MITYAFSVYDSGIEAFNLPFFMLHENEAIRGFKEVVNDSSTKIHKYPEHYSIFLVGKFDSQNGIFTPERTPKLILTALEAKSNS